MAGITIQNLENQNDKLIGISFRRKDQLAADVILSLVQKVSQSNARFNALDKLIMTTFIEDACGFRAWNEDQGQAALSHGPPEKEYRREIGRAHV